MVDTNLTDLPLLDISSVTVPGSLFFYIVNDGAARKVSAQDMSASMLGGVKQYATVAKNNEDWEKNIHHDQTWTTVVHDTYGLVDPSSANLFRIPDDSIKYAQLMGQPDWEQYLASNGGVQVRMRSGGLPDPDLNYADNWHNLGTTEYRHQVFTPRMRVQSGSYFWMSVRQSHSVDRMHPEFNREFCFHSIWCW